MQAYGEDQRFEHFVRPSGGFEVLIEMPYQVKRSVITPEQISQKTQQAGPIAGATVQGILTA
jgi:two-component system, LytTR family, sensor kinase